MSEFMGLVHGVYDAKATGFLPGGASLHSCMSPHGPDLKTVETSSNIELKPHKQKDTLAFMFESCHVFKLTDYAMETNVQPDYHKVWQGLESSFREEDN